VEDGRLILQGLIATDDGSEHVRGQIEGPVAEAGDLGAKLAEELQGLRC